MKLYDNTTENGQNYRNPVLYMDYSDPDVIRVGEDYYMVASSFTYLPGVPLLHSRDLIHWEQLAWCVEKLPFARYDLPAHGCGTWAPAIRYHDGMFYVFIPLPDEGILSQLRKIPQARGVSCTASSRPAAGSTPARSGTTTAAPTWPTPTPRAAVASSTASMSAAWPQTQAACWTTGSRCSTTS